MKLKRTAMLAAALATAGTISAPTQARADSETEAFVTLFYKVYMHYSVLLARSFVDLTYDQISVEPGTLDLVVTGLKVYPVLDYDQEGKCIISADRIVGHDAYSFKRINAGYDLTGVTVPAACFEPEIAGAMQQFGYEEIKIDSLSYEIGYSMPDSSADMSIRASIADALDIDVNANFSYLWFNIPIDGYGDPMPVAQLASAEVSIENKGLYDRLEPMVGAQMGGDPAAIPQLIQMSLGQMLGAGREMSDVEKAFIDNMATEVGRFLNEKNRLVVTAAPEGGVWLDESACDSPQNIISALRPSFSGVPSAYRKVIPPSMMQAALSGGASPEDALRIGEALVTGVGAPRSIEDAAKLLEPLARNWNGSAAAMLAEGYASVGENEKAYEMALLALAAGEMSALSTADSMEAELSLDAVLATQEAVGNAWPEGDNFRQAFEAAVAAGDVGAIRKIANDVSVGRAAPRSYKVAYMLATLAAAGGDRGAASLRDRMDIRFADDDGWRAAAADASSTALQIWNDGGLGAAIADRAK